MITLNYPVPDFQMKTEENKTWIFDRIRKKYVVLTREEWVRQNILAYLCRVMNYPQGIIAIEKEIKVNNLKKRYDIVVYGRDHKPWMLIECKEPDTIINDTVLQQLLRYHTVLQCPYWMLSNGLQNFCAVVANGRVEWLNSLPAYNGGVGVAF